MEINGKPVTQEAVDAWLSDKKYQLWADWLIGDSKSREKAAAWFVNQLSEFASA